VGTIAIITYVGDEKVPKSWLKLIGCTGLALAVIVVGYIFWPAGPSEPPEAKEAEQIREQGNNELTRQMKLRQLETRRSAVPGTFSREEVHSGRGTR
jgi:hypothetical protein